VRALRARDGTTAFAPPLVLLKAIDPWARAIRRAQTIVVAWVLTLPAAAVIGAACYTSLRMFG